MTSYIQHKTLFFTGYYCNVADDLSGFTSYPCPEGYYCPNGTRYSTEFPCPAGSYNPYTLLTEVSECTPCDTGKYCDTPGLTNYTGQLASINITLFLCS